MQPTSCWHWVWFTFALFPSDEHHPHCCCQHCQLPSPSHVLLLSSFPQSLVSQHSVLLGPAQVTSGYPQPILPWSKIILFWSHDILQRLTTTIESWNDWRLHSLTPFAWSYMYLFVLPLLGFGLDGHCTKWKYLSGARTSRSCWLLSLKITNISR